MKKIAALLAFLNPIAFVSAMAWASVNNQEDGTKPLVSLTSMLDEMLDRWANTEFPEPYYEAAQTTSYDRHTVSPDQPGWYGNDDGRGFIRTERINGRDERVLFDETGPGAVTRLWITTSDKKGVLHFYFDGTTEPQLTIPAFDLNKFPLPIGEALMFNHTHYSTVPYYRGGNTSYLPMPYARSLKITIEEDDPTQEIVRYYQVGFRKYDAQTEVRSFSLEEMEACGEKLQQVNARLLQPQPYVGGKLTKTTVENGSTVTLNRRNAAICGIRLLLHDDAAQHYDDVVNFTRIQLFFDGKRCVDAPLCDFFGSGQGGHEQQCEFTDCDGERMMQSRWLMPYSKKATIKFVCPLTVPFAADIEVVTDHHQRTPNTLYFHGISHGERNVEVKNVYDLKDVGEWRFADLSGRGIYVADVLSVNNKLRTRSEVNDDRYWVDWYGEGDEKIYIDDDVFPRFHGTGTEDYYNCSWAPVARLISPFGGVIRVDDKKSNRGLMTWQRTRLLDGITFGKRMRFNFEMEGQSDGRIDLRATYFWYGDL